MKNLILFGSLLLLILSCTTDINEVDAITNDEVFQVEEARGVKILYSDSAQVQVRITADSMVRYTDRLDPRDEFPSGIFVEFLNSNGKPYSYLKADNAIRLEKDNKVIARGNVSFYNTKNDKLTSTELIWEEGNGKLWTNKFVRITQPEKGDTSFGHGFEANQEFTQFEIKRNTSSRFNIDKFKENIEK